MTARTSLTTHLSPSQRIWWLTSLNLKRIIFLWSSSGRKMSSKLRLSARILSRLKVRKPERLILCWTQSKRTRRRTQRLGKKRTSLSLLLPRVVRTWWTHLRTKGLLTKFLTSESLSTRKEPRVPMCPMQRCSWSRSKRILTKFSNSSDLQNKLIAF